MSETKRDVTVYDRVPSTASVSVAQVEAYLRRTHWTLRSYAEFPKAKTWAIDGASVLVWSDASSEDIARAIVRIAEAEDRQPSAVLAEIEREAAS